MTAKEEVMPSFPTRKSVTTSQLAPRKPGVYYCQANRRYVKV